MIPIGPEELQPATRKEELNEISQCRRVTVLLVVLRDGVKAATGAGSRLPSPSLDANWSPAA